MQTLNPSQQQAVNTLKGKVLILAGAGSGKTSVLVHRIAHLTAKGVPPKDILGLTFTNKAAAEMRERVAKKIGKEKAKEIALSTFHSFCMKVLRQEIHHLGFTTNFTLYDENDVKRLMRQMVEHDEKAPPPHELQTRFKDVLRAHNALDFDHLIHFTNELFEKHPEVLEKYQFPYIMIDEYQDTNEEQYQLAQHLSAKFGNLCVVGDDDQSIYGWRGADVKHILNFPADHTIKLEQNYRSTPSILKAANAVIKNNKERHDKSLISTHQTGKPITVFHTPSEEEEVEAIIRRIQELRDQEVRLKDIAILYRSNILARPFEQELIRRRIPYQIYGGLELTARAEIKDILAYLRILVNPKDNEALHRIINYPRRGISTSTLDQLTKVNRAEKIPLLTVLERPPEEITPQGKRGIGAFLALYAHAKTLFETLPLHQALTDFLDIIQYKDAIHGEVKSEKMREMKWDNVQSLVQMLKSFQEENGAGTLTGFLSDTQLDTSHQKKKKEASLGVNLMTFHSAKGLEFPHCFLVGVEDHIIPHEKCTSEEEERRLLYVAITRAMQNLTISMAKKRKRRGIETPSSPSRFLFEIPKDIINVTHWKTLL